MAIFSVWSRRRASGHRLVRGAAVAGQWFRPCAL